MNLLDHEEGKFWIASMHQLARAYRQGCSMAGCRWGQTAGSYVQMLRGHIEAENQTCSLAPRK